MKNNHPETPLFATVKVGSDEVTPQQAEALLTRADQEIELRIRTPFSTTETLEVYAEEFAKASGRVLLAIRQADWHKPYLRRESPHPIATQRWQRWILDQEKQRRRNPRIRIVDESLSRVIESAQDRASLARYGKPRKTPPDDPIQLLNEWVSPETVLWVARELAGVSELTLLPMSSTVQEAAVRPVTATFATPQAIELIDRGIDLLAVGNKPVQAARDIIWGTGGAVSEAMRTRNTQRVGLYRIQWENICTLRGYDPSARMRPCVCRYQSYPAPRTFAEYVKQWAQAVFDEELHQPECYERLIDILTYWSDWTLAESRIADAIGDRHSLIACYRRELAKALRAGIDVHS